MKKTSKKTAGARTRSSSDSASAEASSRRAEPRVAAKKASAYARKRSVSGGAKRSIKPTDTAISQCVRKELRRYYDMLEGQEPANVYHMVMQQAEHALIESVMKECGGNQSKATKWLGISRGNLRNKLAEMGYEKA